MTDLRNLKIGVLALQGDFERHLHQLSALGLIGIEVRKPDQLADLDGLILPGGESTTMSKLIDRFGLRQPMRRFLSTKPVWGTCAGMILLAQNIENNQANVVPFGVLDIDVIRNGYGRQVYSTEKVLKVTLDNGVVELQATFIRAPRVSRVGEGVEAMAFLGSDPVLVRQNNILASAFHTELDEELSLLCFFLQNFCCPEQAGKVY